MQLINDLAKPFYLKGSDKQGILFIHGFTGSPAKLKLLGEHIHKEAGYTVHAPLLTGHATSLKDMIKASWKDWINDVSEAYNTLRQNCNSVCVIGLSMGGVLGLILAEREPVEKLVTIEAAIRFFDKKIYLTRAAKYIVKYSEWKDFREKFPEEADEYLLDYNIGYGKAPIKSMADMLKLIKIAEFSFNKIRCPSLIIHSEKDETVKPESAELIYNNISSEIKEILMLKNSRHISPLGPEREIIYERILSFLKP